MAFTPPKCEVKIPKFPENYSSGSNDEENDKVK